MRKSGEPYITHPLAVTLILAELGAETTTLTASLLHDTVEDTEVTLDQVKEEFGDEVCYLVDGVTKLEKVDHGAAAEPRPSARCSSPPATTSGSCPSSSRTGCTTCAPSG